MCRNCILVKNAILLKGNLTATRNSHILLLMQASLHSTMLETDMDFFADRVTQKHTAKALYCRLPDQKSAHNLVNRGTNFVMRCGADACGHLL